MKKKIVVVIGIIVLFVGVSVVSAINNNVESVNVIDEIGNLNVGTETFYPTDDTQIYQPCFQISLIKPTFNTLYIFNNDICFFPITVIIGNIEMIAEVDPTGETVVKINFIIDGICVASFDPNPTETYYFNWTRDIQLPGQYFASLHYVELQVLIQNGEASYGFNVWRLF